MKNKKIEYRTYKLLSALVEGWVDTGNDEYAEAARKILKIIRELRK
jgi:hypothetical protein